MSRTVADAHHEELRRELGHALDGEVRFDDGTRAVYSRDGSNYRQVPMGVVIPRHKEDVVRAVALCREAAVPLLGRGGGTSLAGQCCNAAVVLDFSKYMRDILELDPEAERVRVLPGTVLDDVRGAAAEHDLTFGADPATHEHCTFGGMIGNNACGPHSVIAGKTVDHVEELEVLTYDGVRMRVGRTTDEQLRDIERKGGRRAEIYAGLRDLRDRYGDLIRERYPDIPRRVSGYNLDDLLPENGFDLAKALVGTEGTCVTYLEATVRLVHWPPHRTLVVLGYPDVYEAAAHVPEIMEHGPLALEGIDRKLLEGTDRTPIGYVHREGLREEELPLLPEGEGWLLVEMGGESEQEADGRARDLIDALGRNGEGPSARTYESVEQEGRVWEIRELGLGATARVPGIGDAWPGWEDSAVPPERLDGYLRDLGDLFDDYGYDASIYGHFGQGCVHCRIPFDLKTAEGLRDYRSFLDEASDLVISYGGSFSGEHGDGQSRGELLPKMFGGELMDAFREFKRIWDPDWKMNPGKVIDPNPITANLATGADYSPRHPETHFRFPEDDGSFARATTRCVGVGRCRRMGGGTMCPSYQVTREEMHSTRGRARILFEMLNGEEIDGWRSEEVKEALDLCLSCKGCKSDCPVSVDMATYKAEFLSHYYEGRLRPRHAYAMGLVHWGARLASLTPRVANFITGTPGLSRAAKWVAGVAPERDLPRLAGETFREWFARNRPAPLHGGDGHPAPDGSEPWGGKPAGRSGPPRAETLGGRRVLLFPDTFSNFFFPDTLRAGLEVLESAGCEVSIPPRILCCGRPLYDYGMLDLARRQWRQMLEVLRPQIQAGIPVVGLEPSCVAAFRDELPGLFPHDQDARRLERQTFTLEEFLVEELDWQPPAMEGRAIVHGHCQGGAIMGHDAEKELLSRMGLDVRVLESGCCGMAGSFGFEADHYEVSMACGERVYLPAIREAAEDTRVIADGFSCREQAQQALGRRPTHVAELLREGLRAGQLR